MPKSIIFLTFTCVGGVRVMNYAIWLQSYEKFLDAWDFFYIFGLNKSEIDSRVNDIIEFSELEDYIDNPVRTYSSGMYMRLAFSIAINVDAEILLIDEILAVGDQHFQEKCFNKLHELKESDKTIVIVSHDLGNIEKLCNRAIWIDEGLVASDGEPKKVIAEYLKKRG